MKVNVIIELDADPSDFNDKELVSDIRRQFHIITGYDIEDINLEVEAHEWDKCPECDSILKSPLSGGVKCTNDECGYFECF